MAGTKTYPSTPNLVKKDAKDQKNQSPVGVAKKKKKGTRTL